MQAPTPSILSMRNWIGAVLATGIMFAAQGSSAQDDDSTDQGGDRIEIQEDFDIDLEFGDADWDSFSEEILLAVQDALANAKEDLQRLEEEGLPNIPDPEAMSLEAMKAAEKARALAMEHVAEALENAEKIRTQELERAHAEIDRARAEIQAALAEIRRRAEAENE